MSVEDEWKIASTRKMASYGCGYIVVNYLLLYGLATLMFFYEVVVGLEYWMIMAAYVIFALWNMVNDPLLGWLTDKPRKSTRKYGLRAPWVWICTGPMLFIYIFIWTPPSGVAAIMILIYFLVLTFSFDGFFSIYNDAIYAGYANQFPSEYERRRSFALMTFMLGLTLTLMSVLQTFIISAGGVTNRSTYLTVAVVMCIILIPFSIIMGLGAKESETMKQMFIQKFEEAEKVSFWHTLKTALTTKNFVISLAGYTCQVTATSLWNASMLYMWKDVFALDYGMYILPQLLGMIAFLLVIPFWAAFAKRNGFKKTYWVCFVLHGLSFLPFLFITNYLLIVVFIVLWNVFYAGEIIMLMPVAADTYDQVALRMGRRQDATFVGVRNFFFRIAFLIMGIVIPLTHFLTGYIKTDNLGAQPMMAVWGVRFHAVLLPMLIFIGMGLIFRRFFTLDGAEKETMKKELRLKGLNVT